MSLIEQLPGSVVTYICQFITTTDLLQLRVTSSKLLAFLCDGEYADIIWRNVLIENFGFDADSRDYLQTLRIHRQWRQRHNSRTQTRTSIFGYEFSEDGSVFTATNAFESWRRWSKASKIFLDGCDENDRYNEMKEIINAPYFLRAACLWKKFGDWCIADTSGFGGRLLATLAPGVSRAKGRFLPYTSRRTHALEAIFAFCDGQDIASSSPIAFFGGYIVYNHSSFMKLCTTELAKKLKRNYPGITTIACNYTGQVKFIGVNAISDSESEGVAKIYVRTSTNFFPACKNDTDDSALLWMEEHVARLETNYLEITTKYHSGYPILSSFPSVKSSLTSRRVTNGIEVIASSTSVVEIEVVAYSIRIRLLTPGEDGYESPDQRGFQTCQLQSRHWRIYDTLTNEVDNVEGDGVIGLYPLLFEGGYKNYHQNRYGTIQLGEEDTGTFQYQSCANIEDGTFSGKLKFIPGSISEPTGDPFFANLGEIPLKLFPDYSY